MHKYENNFFIAQWVQNSNFVFGLLLHIKMTFCLLKHFNAV